MNKYKVFATTTVSLETVIQADNAEEAQRIAEYDLLIDDFDHVNSDFKLDLVIEIKEGYVL